MTTQTLTHSKTRTAPAAKAMLWAGRLMGGLAALFLLLDGIMKLVKPAPVLEACARLGYSENTISGIGVLLLACTALYVFPRTAILGAVLLTAYLGGATATHVRVGQPFFFPVLMGLLVWGGVYFRDARLRALLPLQSSPAPEGGHAE